MRTRTSRAGRTIAERGFTLLEVLVVLIIIGLALALVPGFLLKGSTALTLDQTAVALADQLRDTRGQAVLRNQETLFAIDVERRLFRGGEAAAFEIGSDITISLVTAQSERSGETSGRIRFFPDGSTTGGRIVLLRDNDRRSIEVDWLTGVVSVMLDDR